MNTSAPDNISDKVKCLILQFYTPAAEMKEASLVLSTEDIFLELQRVYPSEDAYNPLNVAIWMEELGFILTKTGSFRFEWMLRKV